MNKDELIKKETGTFNKQADLVQKAMLSKSSEKSLIPNLNFMKIQREIILITEDIKKLGKSSFLMKMRNTILPTTNAGSGKKNHLDGSIIGKQIKSPAVAPMISDIGKDPTSASARVKLVRTVMADKREQPISFYKDLMIQAALPIYLGDITPASIQIAGQTYRLYLRQVIAIHKKKMLLMRSNQLKNMNVERIPIESLISFDKDDIISPEEQALITEIKITLKLLEYTETLDKDTRSSITLPLNLSELDQLSSKHAAVMQFLGTPEDDSPTYNKHQLIIRKTCSMLDIAKRIPVLHSVALKVADRLQDVEKKMPIPFLMEARIHMQALKVLTLRMMMDDNTAHPAISPTFKKAMTAYRKAVRRASFTDPKRGDVPVLAEFAQISYYSFQHRKMLRLTNQGVLDVLKLGKKAVDAASLINRRYSKLQMQILTAISGLENVTKKPLT